MVVLASPQAPETHTMATEDFNFRFVCMQNPDGIKDRKARRLVRSHAMKQALEKKRKLQQQSGLNFRVASVKVNCNRPAGKKRRINSPASPHTPSSDVADDFEMVFAESARLQTWLTQNNITKQRTQPVFSVADELVLLNYSTILKTSLHDSALLNAALLTFSFAATGVFDLECLAYQSEALNSIRAKLDHPGEAASESTVAAILLLAGMEARLTMPAQAQIHLNAVQQLLSVCQAQGVHLTDGIKRAIFWQDLNTSVMTGSKRIVNHTTFAELRWRRDPFAPDAFVLPPGFQNASHLLTEDFTELLKDIHALQCVRDSVYFAPESVMSMAQIDNHQASIQSRLVDLPKTSSFLDSCHLGAYICSTMLRCQIWRHSVVPSHLSLHLLHKLQKANTDLVWDENPNVLVWLLYIGGAFAPTGDIRSGYMALLRSNQDSRFKDRYGTWPEVLSVLAQFIWSENAFRSQVKAFWGEVS